MSSRQDPHPHPQAATAAVNDLASRYFHYLAQTFPTLCSHDEFMFFPRAAARPAEWWRLAFLEESTIQAAATRVAALKAQLEALLPGLTDLDTAAAATLLRQSLNSVLRELGSTGPWARDPFFYLKVAALAWAPVLAGTPPLSAQDDDKVGELLGQVARLFVWAAKQVKGITLPISLLSAGAFADTCRFFDEVLPAFLAAQGFSINKLKPLLSELSRNLRRFREKVALMAVTAPYARGEKGLLGILTESWGWDQDLEEAATVIAEEIAASREALTNLAADLNPGLTWRRVLETLPTPEHRGDLLSLYRGEIRRLWRFWEDSPLLPGLAGRVEVALTPIYLRSLRASASYAAPWGPAAETPGYFYVSPDAEDRAHQLRHHPFLSAHETVPGHHLLDSLRASLTCPIARQYESPLYYEGWACYAETLLLSEGYLDSIQDRLVGWQRRLWRALRGQVDLELHRGRWDLEEGRRRLGQAGYPADIARVQALQLALNPGYQLCYTLGLKGILRLREEYVPALGLARFHEILLNRGQLPFAWVEKRLKAAAA